MFVRYMLAVQGNARQVKGLETHDCVLLDLTGFPSSSLIMKKALEMAKKVVAEGVRITEDEDEKKKVRRAASFHRCSVLSQTEVSHVLSLFHRLLDRAHTRTGSDPAEKGQGVAQGTQQARIKPRVGLFLFGGSSVLSG